MRSAKAALRLGMREARQALTAEQRSSADARISSWLVELTLARGARSVALFAGVAGEADPSGAAQALADAGCLVVWPRVCGPGLLSFHEAPRQLLAPGFRGIPEPPADQAEHPWESLDLAAIPGLAFTADGHRLGQGGGFYDRLLASPRRPFAVGVAYALQVVAALPREAHDEQVDAVLTEAGPAEAPAP